jgi:hypothetical protein
MMRVMLRASHSQANPFPAGSGLSPWPPAKAAAAIVPPPKGWRPSTSIVAAVSFFSAIVLLTGCNTTRYAETTKDGSHIEVVNSRVFWSSQQYAVTLPNGAQMSATGSKGDSEAIKAAIEGSIGAMNAAAAKAALTAISTK